jgi:ribosomal protein L11 methyltransferase
MSILDLGCGSGILAIAAAKLGATRVVALDTDPQAIKATIENAAANDVAHVIEPREGTLGADLSVLPSPSGRGAGGEGTRHSALSTRHSETFDIVAANISGLTLQRLAPGLAAALLPGGTLIASGFLEDAVPGLRSAFESSGLRIDEVIQEGVWRALIATQVP